LPCEPEHWPDFAKLLGAALEMEPAARVPWLDSLPEEHAHLRPALAKVLHKAVEADTPAFLDAPKVLRQGPEFAGGQCIGPYTLEHELGQGGMGEVWLAVRTDGLLKRPVALKLPHPHLLHGSLRARFAREQEILSGLSHPNIATLFDAGVSESSHPYLAMEWVDGLPITEHCRRGQLDLHQRIVLFLQVLEAVDYAHARFVAHRDLKPSNVLVTADGRIKLLDFGIAKLLGDDAANTELTRADGRPATPDYAAPEQLAGEPLTTAVDVYALGVLLFELLTGGRPFDRSSTPKSSAIEAPPASRRIRPEHAPSVGGYSEVQLRKALQGDLDAILAKALEAEPERRYRSAQSFAEDLGRYSRHEPIAARRIGAMGQFIKFVRRNRVSSALAAALLLALLVGGAGVAWEGQVARGQAQRAESEARREKATKDFLLSVFKASDPRIPANKPRGEITARELLEASADRIEPNFAADPETEIELLGIGADLFDILQENQRSLDFATRQVALARQHYGELHPIYLDAQLGKIEQDLLQGHLDEAKQTLQQSDVQIHRAGLDHAEPRARWWFIKSIALKYDNMAQQPQIEALQASYRLYTELGATGEAPAEVMNELGNVYFARKEYVPAADYYQAAIHVIEADTNRSIGDLVRPYANLGGAAMYSGDFGRAEYAFSNAVELALKTFGPHYSYYWTTLAQFAESVQLSGNRARADSMLADLNQVIPARGPYDSASEEQDVSLAHEYNAAALLAEGRPQAAIPLIEQAIQEEVESKQAPLHAWQQRELLSMAYDEAGRHEQAGQLIQEALQHAAAKLAPDHPTLLRRRELWGWFLLGQSRDAEAATQFNEVINQGSKNRNEFVALAYGGLAQLAVQHGDIEKALADSGKAVQCFEHVEGLHDVRTGPRLWRIRASALMKSGHLQEAEVLARQSLDADRRYDDAGSAELAAAESALEQVHAALLSSSTH
jgi:serine/threonine-protein kinase